MMDGWILHGEEGRQPTPLKVELAMTAWSRLCGLLGRKGLESSQALWLHPCNSVHCCFMQFAIDVVYLDSNGVVLHIHSYLKPWRFSICKSAASVLELAAGESHRLGIHLGDQLKCAIV